MPTILPAPGAPTGSVTRQSLNLSGFRPTDAVLCRNTAPLIRLAFRCLRANIPCRILGKDIGASLITLYRKLKTDTPETTRAAIRRWISANERKADRGEALLIFLDKARNEPELESEITRLFSDRHGVLTFSTIHKAKGLEWDRVFILDSHLIPSRYATSGWQLTQERNLLYVAITRAKHDLIYTSSEL